MKTDTTYRVSTDILKLHLPPTTAIYEFTFTKLPDTIFVTASGIDPEERFITDHRPFNVKWSNYDELQDELADLRDWGRQFTERIV